MTLNAKQQLETLKAELLERVERTHKHLYGREERVSAKFSEQSVEMENQELVMNLDSEARAELIQIEHAMQRLENGEYGRCLSCGEEINPERLAAIPYVEQCIACAQGAE